MHSTEPLCDLRIMIALASCCGAVPEPRQISHPLGRGLGLPKAKGHPVVVQSKDMPAAVIDALISAVRGTG
jgi:hypothetical protein